MEIKKKIRVIELDRKELNPGKDIFVIKNVEDFIYLIVGDFICKEGNSFYLITTDACWVFQPTKEDEKIINEMCG